jgi:hypothetical protein
LHATVGVDGDIAEGVEAHFDVCHAHLTSGVGGGFRWSAGHLANSRGSLRLIRRH